MMDLNFLPKKYLNGLNNLDIKRLYEIRLRSGFEVKINFNSNWCYLSDLGATIVRGQALICDSNDINEIILNVTKHSLYAYNDNVKQGYLTINSIRIGLCGECVFQNEEIVTIKNITSLNIRIPHKIIGCSESFFYKIIEDKRLYNTLIISPPFCGKTTILKDLVDKINNLDIGSILLIDERAEFESVEGINVDRIVYSNKLYAFEYGIRSMSPSIIITDELSSKEDWLCVKRVNESGVKIIATCHASNVNEVRKKDYFIRDVFFRYVELNGDGVPGVVNCIYNEDFEII